MIALSIALGGFALFANISALRAHLGLLRQHRAANSDQAVLTSIRANVWRSGFRILGAILTILAVAVPTVILSVLFILQVLLVAVSVSDWLAARKAAREVSRQWNP